VVFGCLADVDVNLGTASGIRAVWYQAEVLLRNMLRWALRLRNSPRSSFMYLFSNCPTVQLLVLKKCVRFFRKMENPPVSERRFVASMYSAI
jgi:hypothetical protein